MKFQKHHQAKYVLYTCIYNNYHGIFHNSFIQYSTVSKQYTNAPDKQSKKIINI